MLSISTSILNFHKIFTVLLRNVYSILSHKFTNTLTIHQIELEVEKRRNKFSILSHDNTWGKFLLSIGPYSPTSQIWNIETDKHPITEDQRVSSLGGWGRELQPWAWPMLNLSRAVSPGLFLHQNFVVWSLLPLQKKPHKFDKQLQLDDVCTNIKLKHKYEKKNLQIVN